MIVSLSVSRGRCVHVAFTWQGELKVLRMSVSNQVVSTVQDRTGKLAAPPAGTSQLDKSALRVRRMFASIARRYDFLNHLLSLNIDRSWRKFTTRVAPPQPGAIILDCCTGTADLALAYDRAAGGASPIVATDFCREMLVIGRDKVKKANASQRITLIESDAQRLPLPNDTFAVVSVAFGLRNVRDTVRGIDEFIRVARPGGKVAILEFSQPRGAVLGRLYLAFFRHVLPRIGQAIAPNDDDAYNYLPRSVLAFPDGQAMLDLLSERGLTDLKQYPLTLGIATLYVGTKPVIPAAPQFTELDR
jgi:demethylmenaquinone methyltransferase/2-methoxy-6-polyprenyl-1,4-benzoquinol methylase